MRDDDAAAVVIDSSGAVVTTLDAERPRAGQGQFEQPLYRVSPIVRAGAFVVQSDATQYSELGTTIVTCGALRSTWYQGRIGRTGLEGHYLPAAVFQCRTLAPERPFVFGVRAELDDNARLTGSLRLLAGADQASTLSSLAWQLPMQRPGDERALRELSAREIPERNQLEGLVATRVGEMGWYVAFRFRAVIYGGWLDPSLTAVGALTALSSSPTQVGLPALANNGREVLLVHAARTRDDERWRLVASKFTARAHPSPAVVLSLPTAPSAHLFAPSVDALPDGWAVSYTLGPLRGVLRGGPKQHVWLAVLDAQLALRGSPSRMSDELGGSDARIAASGTTVRLVYMGGQDRWRSVRFVSARCDGSG
jgi:hypothetical protein